MTENRRILLLGAGGHSKSVLDSIISMSCYDTIALIENRKEASIKSCKNNECKDSLMGFPIVGGDDDLERLFLEGYKEAFITVGSIGDVVLRRKLYTLIKKIGFHIPNIIDKSSVVSSFATMGEGVFIGKNAVVNVDAKIGNCAIINSSSVVEHDCVLGDFVHIAPGSILSGKVQVGEGTHIGAGSVIKQGICIGADCMIGMGSVVVKDFGSKIIAFGNPCKEVVHE